MLRLLLLCSICAGLATPLLAQDRGISVEIRLDTTFPDPSCTITAPANIRFPTVVAHRTETRATSSRTRFTAGGTWITGVDVSHAPEVADIFGRVTMRGPADETPLYATVGVSCPATCGGRQVSWNGTTYYEKATCGCTIDASVGVPAQKPAGTYSGSATVTATCSY